MEALDVAPVVEIGGDFFPVAGPVLNHEPFELVVLLGSPPALLGVGLLGQVALVGHLLDILLDLLQKILLAIALVGVVLVANLSVIFV